MFASGNKTRARWLRRGLIILLSCLGAGNGAALAQLEEHRVQDLVYGSALYDFFQEDELSAIVQLMVANERGRKRNQQHEANLLLADLYYSFGLYEESRELFAELLNAEVSDSVQNRIWFNLARLRYEQGYDDHARELLSRISAKLPAHIEAERKYLLTNLYLGNRQYDEAADLSNRIDSRSIWKIYARYNLAAAVIEDDRYEQGKTELEKIGQMKVRTPEMLALRDRANLSLGLVQLRRGLHESAIETLSRIRLEGPMSHEALLASGWAWYRMDQFEKAMLAWRVLLQRNAVDAATQEAILAIPVNYAESGQDALAIRNYEVATQQFEAQLRVLDNAITVIENNGLIASLRENEILYDRSSLQRLPPSSDVTPQLHLFLATHEFQRELKRYQELLDIRSSLDYWDETFPALDLMLQERRAGFEQRLPKLQQSTSFDQLEQLLEQRDRYAAQVEAIEAGEDYIALARPEERDHLDRIERVKAAIGRVGGQRNTAYQQDMLRVLSGLLHYEMETDYPGRFWQAKKQMIQLDRALDESELRVNSLRRIVETSDSEFDGFQNRISGQLQRIRDLNTRVNDLLTKQEQYINQLAIKAIRQQQQHIVQLRLNASFELAKLYDKLAAKEE